MKSYHPAVLSHVNNIFEKNSNKTQIHKLTYFNKKIPKNIENIAEKLRLQCLDIYTALKPLTDIGINFELFLVGGSVRDLVLGKYNDINDLDIMLSFEKHNPNKQITINKFLKQLNIKPEDFPSIAWPHNNKNKPAFSHWKKLFILRKKEEKQNEIDLGYLGYNQHYDKIKELHHQICYDMAYCLIAKHFNIFKSYTPKLKNNELPLDDQYLSHRIKGILKVQDTNWKWNIDILINHDDIEYFLNSFDLGICKIGVGLANSFCSTRDIEYFPKDVNEFFSKMIFDKDFLTTHKSQKHNLNIDTLSLLELKSCVEKHLPKILIKYNFPVIINSKTIHDDPFIDRAKQKKEKIHYINAYLMQKKLNEHLFNKKTIKNLVKI